MKNPVNGMNVVLYVKKYNFYKKMLATLQNILYTNYCCGMIALKREVAARVAGFPWSECQVRKLTTSHCTETEDHEMVENNVCVNE